MNTKNIWPYVDPMLLPKLRRGVGVVLFSAAGIFFARRNDNSAQARYVVDKNGEWVMPQGGIDEGETEEEALARELKEELGIKPYQFNIKATHPELLGYLFEPLIEPAQWMGQAHQWFYGELTIPIEEFSLDSNISSEFSDYVWTTPDAIMKRAQKIHRKVYQELFSYFNRLK